LKDDPNTEIGEREIARHLYLVGWVLMLVIIVVDTAAIVIKTLVKRGNYEELKEKNEMEHRTRYQADAVASNATYPAYALLVKQHETTINEMKDLSTVTKEYLKILNNMMEKTMSEIREIISRSQNKFPNFQNELEESVNATRKKIIELSKRFNT